MKHLSKKRAKQSRDWSDVRADFVAEYGFCWNPVCNSGRDLCCHEMAKGTGNRPLAFERRYCWLVLCGDCNCDAFNDYSQWPLARQLGLKWLHDWEHFYLVAFNVLRRRSSEAITFTEVVIHICRLLDDRGLSDAY